MVCSGISPPARRDLEAYLRRERCIGVEEYLEPLLDIVSVTPPYVGPPLGCGQDIWGVARAPVSYGDGAYDEIVHYPLADVQSVDDVNRYPWPDPDWFDYAPLADAIEATNAGGQHCILLSGGNPFETAWYMRGFERMFEDMAERPELAAMVLDRVTGFYVEFARRQLEASGAGADLYFTADDIGGQTGLLMSLATWERFIKPCHQRLNTTIHEFGIRVIYHSDGAVMKAVPDLIDMGVDVLQALQFDARGMDPEALKSDFGSRLCFQGGISVQSTLPFGTPEDVRREALDRIAVLGRGGGYILGPSHVVQAGTPPENIVAMFDAAATSGRAPAPR